MKVYEHNQYTKPNGRIVNGFYIDEKLKKNLDHLKRRVQAKYDGIFMISGFEGTGKTTFSQMIGHYLDPSLHLGNVVFTGEQFMQAVQTAKKGQCIIWDEAIIDLSTQDFSTEMQKILIKFFTTIRSKQLYIMLLIPNPFMIRRYFFVFRTLFLLHTYSRTGIDRGYFKFYSFKRKKSMYLKGYKDWNMSVEMPNFIGRFSNTEGFFINTTEYESKKQEAIKRITESGEKGNKEKLIEAFKDKVLKLEIQNKQWKEKLKEKYEVKFAEIKQKASEIKKKYNSTLEEYKRDNIDALKNKEKTRIDDLERDYSKLIYFTFNHIKEMYKQYKGSDINETLFCKLLKENKIIDKDWSYIKKYYTSGEQILKVIL
jgi:hypothetical protein